MKGTEEHKFFCKTETSKLYTKDRQELSADQISKVH